MITVELAKQLRDVGIVWTPARGDRFAITHDEMIDDVFVLSDMTIEIHHLPDGDLIGFNGTTEWALDAVEPQHAVWLPDEAQLRTLLGGAFTRLERLGGAGWRVTVTVNDREREFADADAAQAYGAALLGILSD